MKKLACVAIVASAMAAAPAFADQATKPASDPFVSTQGSLGLGAAGAGAAAIAAVTLAIVLATTDDS